MSKKEKQKRPETEHEAFERRDKKLKKFYKELTQWLGVSVMLIGINVFLSGNISWAKYPVFFWGIVVVSQVFDVIRMQRLNREYQDKRWRGEIAEPEMVPLPDVTSDEMEDHSPTLLRQPEEREKVDLTEYRKVGRPWKDEDLV
jgi:hypothetical protein